MTLSRVVALAAFLPLLAVATPTAPPAAPFRGLGDVRVIETHVVPSTDASAQTSGGTLDYVVARVELTNDLGRDITPQISHFFLIDRGGNRYAATDSGSSALLGIANSRQRLLANEKREYVLGFRTTDPALTGTIEYDP